MRRCQKQLEPVGRVALSVDRRCARFKQMHRAVQRSIPSPPKAAADWLNLNSEIENRKQGRRQNAAPSAVILAATRPARPGRDTPDGSLGRPHLLNGRLIFHLRTHTARPIHAFAARMATLGQWPGYGLRHPPFPHRCSVSKHARSIGIPSACLQRNPAEGRTPLEAKIGRWNQVFLRLTCFCARSGLFPPPTGGTVAR